MIEVEIPFLRAAIYLVIKTVSEKPVNRHQRNNADSILLVLRQQLSV